jgi:hypothetical protein
VLTVTHALGRATHTDVQMTKGEDATYFGVNLGPATFNNTLAVELALMGFAEVRFLSPCSVEFVS